MDKQSDLISAGEERVVEIGDGKRGGNKKVCSGAR